MTFRVFAFTSLAFAAAVAPWQGISAQSARVRGIVVDSTADRPLADVRVRVRGTQFTTRTSADGRFSISERVPNALEFVRGPTDGDSVVRWRRVPGAASYAIGGGFLAPGVAPIEDTAFVIPRLAPIPGQPPQRVLIRVFALDSNYAVFRSDVRLGQAGVSGGWGVFGSFTWADTDLRPSAAAAAPR